MNIFELLKLSLKNLISFKMRSFLTMLGIIVGIGSVILISSIGAGFQNSLLGDINNSLSNVIEISLDKSKLSKLSLKREYYFSEKDLEDLEKNENIKSAFFSFDIGAKDDKDVFHNILFLDEKGMDAYKFSSVYGRMFNNLEYKSRSNVVLISGYDAKRLYNIEENAIGKKIKLKSLFDNSIINFTIIGTFKDKDDSARRFFGGNYVKLLAPTSEFNADNLKTSFLVNLKDKKNIEKSVSDIKNYLNIKSNNNDIYKVTPLLEELNTITNILDKISIFISLIAAISLIVGGIGVMNIMLVSVTERITEIGLRKAIGAKNKDIMLQFLIESMTLTLIGGIIGISTGYALALLLGIPFKIIPIIKIKVLITAIVVSTVTGLIFGIYPAKKAARLSPMEALKTE